MRLTVDTREACPHPWSKFPPGGWEIERGILETGDFAFSAIPEGAVVERKSASDRPWDSEFPKVPGWWISLAYAVRRAESVDKAEAILLRAQAIHPKVAVIAFNLACYASVAARFEEAKTRLQHAIELDKEIRGLALDDEDLRPLWDWIAHLH